MRPDQSRHRRHGFTALVCHGPACGRDRAAAAVTGLRECVRRHPHGVLVSAGCLLGPLGCHARAAGGAARTAGALLVVQPCSAGRTPTGPALWIGPLWTERDVTVVCRWLDAGDLSTTALPARLRFRATLAERGAAN